MHTSATVALSLHAGTPCQQHDSVHTMHQTRGHNKHQAAAAVAAREHSTTTAAQPQRQGKCSSTHAAAEKLSLHLTHRCHPAVRTNLLQHATWYSNTRQQNQQPIAWDTHSLLDTLDVASWWYPQRLGVGGGGVWLEGLPQFPRPL